MSAKQGWVSRCPSVELFLVLFRSCSRSSFLSVLSLSSLLLFSLFSSTLFFLVISYCAGAPAGVARSCKIFRISSRNCSTSALRA